MFEKEKSTISKNKTDTNWIHYSEKSQPNDQLRLNFFQKQFSFTFWAFYLEQYLFANIIWTRASIAEAF